MLNELLVIGLQEDAFPDDPKGAERLHLLVSCYLQLVKPHLKQQRKSLKRLEKVRRKQSGPGAAQQSGQDVEEGMDES